MKHLWSIRSVALLALAIAASDLGGCVEGGALIDSDLAARTFDTVADNFADAIDKDSGEDSASESDTSDTADSSGTADGVDSGGDTDVSADTGPVFPCLVDSECDGISDPQSLCDGVVACVDYRCQVDPATVVFCDDPQDPCLSVACNPATGLCDQTVTCTCEPDEVLPCGVTRSYSTSDFGTTYVLDDDACAVEGAEERGFERTFRFSVPTAERVRITVDSPGVQSVRVMPLAGAQGAEVCLPEQCLVGGREQVLFDAEAGVTYAVALEHSAFGKLVQVKAECGVNAESDCGDGIDEDGDGVTDCGDPDCEGIGDCVTPPTQEIDGCFDLIDNDGDGATDCDDEECWVEPVCLQACGGNPMTVLCGFNQGTTNGGGKTKLTGYSCAPDAPAKEIVYRFAPATTQFVTVTLSAGGSGLGLAVLQDLGWGCTSNTCLSWGANQVSFTAIGGQTYWFAVDGPAGVVSNFSIDVGCD